MSGVGLACPSQLPTSMQESKGNGAPNRGVPSWLAMGASPNILNLPPFPFSFLSSLPGRLMSCCWLERWEETLVGLSVSVPVREGTRDLEQ